MNGNARLRLLQAALRTGDAHLRQALWRLLSDRQLQQRAGALAADLARSLAQMLEGARDPGAPLHSRGDSAGGAAIHRNLREMKLLRRLLLDERVPLWQKAIPVAAALYLVSPLDLVPDFLPVLGQLDDLAVLLAGLRLFRSLAPPALIEEHLAAIDGEVVDAPGWRTHSTGAGTQSSGTGTQSSGTGTADFVAGTGTGTHSTPQSEDRRAQAPPTSSPAQATSLN